MAAGGSTTVILIAMGANFGIACAKFAAAAWTGSSAMFSEAIHSVVDTSNQALLLWGIKRAKRKADAKHPFGYSKELYFWSFIVAILLFSLGAGVSLYEGVEKFYHPHPIDHPEIIYVVLGLAIGLEGFSTYKALAEFRTRNTGKRFVTALQRSKDPALFAIVLEDVAAMFGLFAALIGVLVADKLGYLAADGIASIAIGLVLASVAVFMAIEIKGLIIGEAADPEVQSGLFELITAEAGETGPILAINEIRTMHLGPTDILVAASVDFRDGISAEVIEETTGRLEESITDAYPQVRKLFIEVQSIQSHAAALERDGLEDVHAPAGNGVVGGGIEEKAPVSKAATRVADAKPVAPLGDAGSKADVVVKSAETVKPDTTRKTTEVASARTVKEKPATTGTPELGALPTNRKARKSRRKAHKRSKRKS